VSVVAGLTCWWLVRGDGSVRDQQKPSVSRVADRAVHPNAAWRPEEVVRHQLTALRENGMGKEGILRCYLFASPYNRASTGPLARFERMVRSPPYNVMLHATETLVGAAVEQDDRAAVLVTIIDPARSVHVFRFFLSKQHQAPYTDCWMTDAVNNVGFQGTSSPSQFETEAGKTDA
jgi:hypothetical protein